jgi:hypothetical protein
MGLEQAAEVVRLEPAGGRPRGDCHILPQTPADPPLLGITRKGESGRSESHLEQPEHFGQPHRLNAVT